jgi:hypothetical protein
VPDDVGDPALRPGTMMLDTAAAAPGRMLNAGSDSPRIYAGSFADQVRQSRPAAPSSRGAIPTPDEPAPSSGPRPTQPDRNVVADAVHGGIHFLQDIFGLHGDGGAVATPESEQQVAAGARQLAEGRGAATQADVQAIDQAIDPDNQIPDDQKQGSRLAKMTSWYLEQGRPKDAAASAASLLQYGARRFGQFGTLAGAALNAFGKDGDPRHIEAATRIIQQAYNLIPDGGGFDINVDPKTGVVTAVHNIDGQEPQTFTVKPNELPGLIRSMQDGSAYWQQISATADPVSYRQRVSADRRQSEQLAKEGRAETRYVEHRDEGRQYREGHPSGPQVDDAAYKSSLAAATAARDDYLAKFQETMDNNDPDTKALRQKYFAAVSRFSDVLPPSIRSRELQRYKMNDASYVLDSPAGGGSTSPASGSAPAQPSSASTGISPDAGAALAARQPYSGSTPPPNAPGAVRRKADGIWYVPVPGGYSPVLTGG